MLELFIELGRNLSVMLHVAVLQVAFYLGSTLGSQLLHHERKQLARVTDSIYLDVVGTELSWASFRIVSLH
jgi:hypothetical protein